MAIEADLISHESVLVGGSSVAESAKDVGNGIGLVLGKDVAFLGIAVAIEVALAFEVYIESLALGKLKD